MPKTSIPDLGLQATPSASKPVECLGQTFPSDEARRAHFTERLRERLRDPEFRRTPGFPKASDEDILRLSDPPYFTACPNPFLTEFVNVYGKPYEPSEKYEREPLAVDVSEGKSDPFYKTYRYHTKVPYLAIVPSILHYTRPGEIVLDGFGGTGMTGVAAQACGVASPEYKQRLESAWKRDGRGKPEWGVRRAVVSDLSPMASVISANFNMPAESVAFERESQRILRELESELGWMWKTDLADGTRVEMEYVVWSQVFSCPNCASDVVFANEAIDHTTGDVAESFPCPSCGTDLSKAKLERAFELRVDRVTGRTQRRVRFVPLLKKYKKQRKAQVEAVTASDLATIDAAEKLVGQDWVPSDQFPLDEMYHGSRIGPKGFEHVHDLYLGRTLVFLGRMRRKIDEVSDTGMRRALLGWFSAHLLNLSMQNCYRPQVSFPYNPMTGVYYVSSAVCEANPFVAYANKAKRIKASTAAMRASVGAVSLGNGDAASLLLPGNSVDYVFTDPPFGANIPYSDLNFLTEPWLRVVTDATVEATVDKPKDRGMVEYQDLMRRCFSEYHRVLKPGRWMTVVFSNSSNAVWRSIQEAMGAAGFVVADVRTLDKQLGSYRQVTSTAVKQDLVISAYKPTDALATTLEVGSGTAEAAWAFVREHLSKAATPAVVGEEVQVVLERTAQMLHDRMVALHVQRGLAVPMDTSEFLTGLAARYASRDGMYFLPDQAASYDRARAKAKGVGQLDLFVGDEATAIQWVRQQLTAKPQSLADLTPKFMKEIRNWPKHEKVPELRDLLHANFLEYQGEGDVPAQIHDYLSTMYHDLRGLSKQDPKLVAKARGRWYVPDPAKQADIEKLRQRALLREFATYADGVTKKLKEFRTEAVRAGFKDAYSRRDWRTIVNVGRRLPEQVVQEDEQLLMYYDVASTNLGD